MDVKNGRDVARAVSSLVNGYGDEGIEDFVGEMANDHRTLQQRFTRLCVAWFERLATLDESWYDLRNEASVKLAKKFVERLDRYDRALPMI